MKHLVIPTVNVFIFSGTKLLLGRRASTSWMDGYLCPPGGHIEEGETPVLAMLREINEELGTAVHAEDLEFACVAARNTPAGETVAFEFIIRDKDYTFINAELEKCSELVWVELTDLPDDIIDEFKQIIELGIIQKRPYIEIGY
jgi:ADP-ribose pyrophosphatase YjhB (NUDIX family)